MSTKGARKEWGKERNSCVSLITDSNSNNWLGPECSYLPSCSGQSSKSISATGWTACMCLLAVLISLGILKAWSKISLMGTQRLGKSLVVRCERVGLWRREFSESLAGCRSYLQLAWFSFEPPKEEYLYSFFCFPSPKESITALESIQSSDILINRQKKRYVIGSLYLHILSMT